VHLSATVNRLKFPRRDSAFPRPLILESSNLRLAFFRSSPLNIFREHFFGSMAMKIRAGARTSFLSLRISAVLTWCVLAPPVIILAVKTTPASADYCITEGRACHGKLSTSNVTTVP